MIFTRSFVTTFRDFRKDNTATFPKYAAIIGVPHALILICEKYIPLPTCSRIICLVTHVPANMQIYWNKEKCLRKEEFNSTGYDSSSFWNTNMAAVTSC